MRLESIIFGYYIQKREVVKDDKNNTLLVTAKRKANLKMFENKKKEDFAEDITSSPRIQIPPLYA